jgi:hypothetical protein
VADITEASQRGKGSFLKWLTIISQKWEKAWPNLSQWDYVTSLYNENLGIEITKHHHLVSKHL